MWKAVQTIGDGDEEFFEDGSSAVSKKLKGADRSGKILKIGADTGKMSRRRKVLTKAIKKQITKHIRKLNPTNISLLSYRYTSALANGTEGPGHSK